MANKLTLSDFAERVKAIPESEIGTDGNITRIIPSNELLKLIEAATHEQVQENFEKVVEVPQADVHRLKSRFLHQYEPIITQAIQELSTLVKQLSACSDIDYRWQLLSLKSGTIGAKERRCLIIPLDKDPGPDLRVVFHTLPQGSQPKVYRIDLTKSPRQMFLLDRHVFIMALNKEFWFLSVIFYPDLSKVAGNGGTNLP